MDVSQGSSGRRRALLAVAIIAVLVAVVVVLAVRLSSKTPEALPPADQSSVLPGTTSSAGAPAPTTPATSRATSSATTSPAATPSPPPPPSVPPPSTTGAPTVVAERPVERKEADLSEKVAAGEGVSVAVSDVEAVKGTARGPGEVAGPALRVTVEVTNETSRRVPMNLAVVNLYYGSDSTPAAALSGPGARPFRGAVPAGGTASGRYVFNVPRAEQGRIEVEFSYSTEAPTVIFRGTR